MCSCNRFVPGMVALGACVCFVLTGMSVADDRVATPVASDGDHQPPQRVLPVPVMRGAGVGRRGPRRAAGTEGRCMIAVPYGNTTGPVCAGVAQARGLREKLDGARRKGEDHYV